MTYKDKSEPIEVRVKDLLSRMTIEEKVAQTLCIYAKKGNFQDEQGHFDENKVKKLLLSGAGRIAEVGFVEDTPKKMAELTNKLQAFYLEESRLGIPVIFHEECLHGQMVKEATSFPQPIALAGSWNPQLIQDVYALVAEETRSRGGHHALTPVADVAREPRWGRVEETFGEDTYLVSKMTVAATKGFQGEKGNFNTKKNVIATLKHFVAHAQPEGGSNCAPVNVSERVLREVFFPPFQDAINEAGAMSVMASYNEVDGLPSHKNKWLLDDVLRKEWGFEGFTVSDYYAVYQLKQRHNVAIDEKEAAFQAFSAGIDVEMPFDECYHHLTDLVKEGRISEAYLDKVVSRLLAYKFRMGLFDDPYVDPEYADSICGSEQQRSLALKAACEAITLLKNDNEILPLNTSKIKTIAVIGPNANEVLLGGYSGKPKFYTTVLDGIKEKVGDTIDILYAEGCKITEPGDWEETDEVIASNSENDKKGIAEAIKIAERADVVILAIGGNALTSREAWNEDHLGDRPSLELVGSQNDLAKAMVETGKPIVSLLFNGKPLSINYVHNNIPAILECWYLGQETGKAVADVLFGDFNPSGKLPISFPRSVGHIPSYYNHKPNDRRGYLFDEVSPLYAFGFGLSYTTFKYSNLNLEKTHIDKNESTRLSVNVENTGNVSGHEVVQMYIHDCVSSVTRPVKELKGFEKVYLKPGETKTITLDITPKELAYWDAGMNFVVDPGTFNIMVGTSSKANDLKTITLTVIS
ncbi:glycoside hydrolase family 3 N-terminal domain-containing protein [Flavivirga spongiicola]|uniref:Glycoside hydrolase family 3 C-terminal domain-containing protein n=1 Tax=Flavivirga spongiicola TaxID=421621 RepID=A0ABU7XWN9_9FLAO|nr:glycoside hydrolase family 3 N-terminal domain-containing protein [Flavivirga sp. MEBiC05379]MDO5980201.1 glycoside hydrolase family 3 N-terminal domain-containing protein [Flavivirga sp. MEBiC05379]